MNTKKIKARLNKANKLAHERLKRNITGQENEVFIADAVVIAAGKRIYKAEAEKADAESLQGQITEY